MKTFHCACGQRVFFENTRCLSCGRDLGFDPRRMDMVALTEHDGVLEGDDGCRIRLCDNQRLHGNCNWLLAADESEALCLSCRMNQLIPALGKPQNLKLWTRVEHAKRRLVYSMLHLGLPFEVGGTPLGFRIMEDRRRNPDVLESFIATGHLDGTITVNVAEADDAARHAIREQMQERYRTVLGHLRHEAGHFYFGLLTGRGEELATCRELFGDEREDYQVALNRYYGQGPAPDWPERYVSAYASAHPAEDFAETFAHVLHIDDALESTRAAGLSFGGNSGEVNWIDEWVEVAITLNEVLRSLGAEDLYPFVLTDAVRRKLEFVNRLVRRPDAPAGG